MRIERAPRLADDLRERASERRASESNESDDCARMIIDIEREEPLNMMMMRNNKNLLCEPNELYDSRMIYHANERAEQVSETNESDDCARTHDDHRHRARRTTKHDDDAQQ